MPEAMAYAGIAGVPPLVGLYTVPIPLIAYALFGTPRTMVVGPDSATALISMGTVGAIVASHSGATQVAEFVAITSALALIVGMIFLLLGLARMGWVANFISTPVMKGFIQGLVWVTIIGQIPKLFGISGEHGNFFEQLFVIIPDMANLNPITTAIGLGCLVLLALIKRFVPRVPAALTALIVSIIVVSLFDLSAQGVDIVGKVEPGLPALAMPKFTLSQLELLIPGALAIVLLGYAETLGAAKAASVKSGGSIDPNQELVSLGPANMGAAFSGGFVVVGSLSKTSVSMGAGGKTQMASLVNAFFVILTLMFLLPLFTNLPHAALAAIVIEAMLSFACVRDPIKDKMPLNGMNTDQTLRKLRVPVFSAVMTATSKSIKEKIESIKIIQAGTGTAFFQQFYSSDRFCFPVLHGCQPNAYFSLSIK